MASHLGLWLKQSTNIFGWNLLIQLLIFMHCFSDGVAIWITLNHNEALLKLTCLGHTGRCFNTVRRQKSAVPWLIFSFADKISTHPRLRNSPGGFLADFLGNYFQKPILKSTAAASMQASKPGRGGAASQQPAREQASMPNPIRNTHPEPTLINPKPSLNNLDKQFDTIPANLK